MQFSEEQKDFIVKIAKDSYDKGAEQMFNRYQDLLATFVVLGAISGSLEGILDSIKWVESMTDTEFREYMRKTILPGLDELLVAFKKITAEAFHK